MRRAATMLCLIAAVVCASAVRTRADLGARAILPGTVGVATVTGLPLGLEWPAGDGASPVLNAIAADIDDDGDLDIVANQGSVELAVWVNDGTGRLTRSIPTPASAPGSFSTSPGVGDPVRDTASTVSTAAPSFDVAPPIASRPLAGAGALNGPPPSDARSSNLTVRSSRAPPLDIRS